MEEEISIEEFSVKEENIEYLEEFTIEDQCDYIATHSGNLKIHKKSQHEGVRYPCDQCDYIATTYGHLKIHKENKHEGVRYPCDQCDYIATRS